MKPKHYTPFQTDEGWQFTSPLGLHMARPTRRKAATEAFSMKKIHRKRSRGEGLEAIMLREYFYPKSKI